MSPRHIIALASSAAVLILAAALPASANEPDPSTAYGYSVNAGGTYVRVLGSTVSSDPTATSNILGSTYPKQQNNTTASAQVGTLLKAGVISTETTATKVDSTITATAKAETAGVSLLNGLIKVDAVKTITEAKRTGTILSGDSNSQLLGVAIKGKTVPLNVSNNFGVTLTGVASIILNEKKVDINGGKVTTTGSALKVTLLKAYEGSPVGTTITINPTTSTLAPTEQSNNVAVGGFAYGTTARLVWGDSISVISGPTARVATPPGGTFGYDLTNTTAGINVPFVLTGGVIRSVANAVTSLTATDVTHSSEIVGVNVLNGLIRADAVKATARSQKLSTGQRIQTPTTQVVKLVISGKAITVASTPNYTITVPGVVRVVVNDQTVSSTGNQVVGLHVTLLAPRSGLKTGAEIFVAVAGSIVY